MPISKLNSPFIQNIKEGAILPALYKGGIKIPTFFIMKKVGFRAADTRLEVIELEIG